MQSINPKHGWWIVLCVTLLLFAYGVYVRYAQGVTNISPGVTEHWAWNDIIQWINFFETNSVIVNSSQLTGYASSSAADISLDCATTRIGNICGTSNYKVFNDGAGNLSGWAWNDVYGWFSFCGGLGVPDCPSSPSSTAYRVRIDPLTGVFTDPLQRNYAWNDVVGWVSFNCDNTDGCGTSDYKVKTTWTATATIAYVDSTTFDMGSRAQLNSVLWQGSLPGSTYVRFQFAVSNDPIGPWSYIGPDGTGNTYYIPSAPNISFPLDYSLHNGYRYFRYRVTLFSDQAQTQTPRVDDVIINWSP